MKVITYDHFHFNETRDFLGKRPGEYRVDPWYLRRTNAETTVFWDVDKKSWLQVRPGDHFWFDEYGTARKDGYIHAAPKAKSH